MTNETSRKGLFHTKAKLPPNNSTACVTQTASFKGTIFAATLRGKLIVNASYESKFVTTLEVIMY